MHHVPKLAIFDVDGTVAVHGKVTDEIIEGFTHLHHLGCRTTLSTGRNIIRLRDVLGDTFHKLVSDDTPIIVEHGAKIVKPDGTVIFGDYFSAEETEHAIDFIRANIGLFQLAWYNPTDPSKKVQFWCINEADVQHQLEARAHYADVFSAPLGRLREILLEEQLSNLSLRLKSFVKVENLKLTFTKTDLNIIFQDGNMEFLKANTNKGLSVLYAAKNLGIELKDILLAGNAINDVEMLDLDVGTSILVAKDETKSTILSYLSSPESIVSVSTPVELGKYLKTLEVT